MKYLLDWIKAHKYCLVLLYFLFYLPAFFILEKVSSPKVTVYCPIDGMIPFIPAFVFPYFAWHLLIPAILIFFMIKDREAFLRLCFTMFTGMTAALFIYAVIPNGLNIRVPVTGNSLPEKICSLLYSIDTPTNVCPSIHVSSTVAISVSVQKARSLKKHKAVKIFLHITAILIIASTLFIKQHSVYDVLAGAALTLILCIAASRMDFSQKEDTAKKLNVNKAKSGAKV